ncbi:MAG: AsmA family protein [Prevotella sp.]|nr:AsmA family protein [Prevotella sp.]
MAKLRKGIRLALKILAVIIAILLLATLIVANSSTVQNKLVDMVTNALSKQLNTEVGIDHIGLNLLNMSASIEGIRLKDQQQRDLLKVKRIWGRLQPLALLSKEIRLSKCEVDSIDVQLIKPEDGPANYQFLLDSSKKDSRQPKDSTKRSGFKFDLKDAVVKGIHVGYNDANYELAQAYYSHWRGTHTVTIHNAKAEWQKQTKKALVSWHLDTGTITATLPEEGKKHVDIKGLELKSNCNLPRRNFGKPHHGDFDDRHFNLQADFGIDILRTDKDSVQLALTRGCVKDTIAGIDLTELKSDITICGKHVTLTNAVVQQVTTRLEIPEGHIFLPNKKDSTSLRYYADNIKGRVMLKDIAQPFAKVLHKFSIPLNLSVNLSGTDDGMLFKDIRVNTDDKKLTINAMGMLRNLKDARKLNLHFEVYEMKAKPGIKDKIINQFTVKKYMMYQVYALGLIRYAGSFDILWKKQQFRGLMNTEKGDVNFDFELDGVNKYLTGNVSTDSLQLGELFQLKQIGDIDCKASFKIDISKPRTALMRREKGGKLPIGHVEADIRKVGYRMIHMHNIVANIESDGAIADGDVTLKGSLTNLVVQFSFTNTEEMHKMKIKPKLNFKHD